MKKQICEVCEEKEADTKFRSIKVCYRCQEVCEQVEKEDRGTNLEDYEEYDDEDAIIPKKGNPKDKINLAINDYINFKGNWSKKDANKIWHTILFKSSLNNTDNKRVFSNLFMTEQYFPKINLDYKIISNLASKFKIPNNVDLIGTANQYFEDMPHYIINIMLLNYEFDKKNYLLSSSLADVLSKVELDLKVSMFPDEFHGYFQLSNEFFYLIHLRKIDGKMYLYMLYPSRVHVGYLELFLKAIPLNYDFTIQHYIDSLSDDFPELYSENNVKNGDGNAYMLALNIVLFCVNNPEFNHEYYKFAPAQIPLDKRNQQEGAMLPLKEIIKLDLNEDYKKIYNDFIVTGKYVRRGHFRWQHYGKRSEGKIKLIFIGATSVTKKERIKIANPIPSEYQFSSYRRVVPRDLFNEAKLLKCLGKIAIGILDGKLGEFELEEKFTNPEDGFEIVQNDDGDIMCENYRVFKGDEELYLFTRLNSKANWPLMTIDHHGEYIDVMDDNGKFTDEFLTYLSEI